MFYYQVTNAHDWKWKYEHYSVTVKLTMSLITILAAVREAGTLKMQDRKMQDNFAGPHILIFFHF